MRCREEDPVTEQASRARHGLHVPVADRHDEIDAFARHDVDQGRRITAVPDWWNEIVGVRRRLLENEGVIVTPHYGRSKVGVPQTSYKGSRGPGSCLRDEHSRAHPFLAAESRDD
jgi:hypothetical protein